MNRRTFSQQLALGGIACWARPALAQVACKKKLKPRRLATGQRIGLIAPASAISDEKIEKAYTNLEGLGLKVQAGRYLRHQHGSFAGTDAERLHDLHAMFSDPTIDAVWCARGGYGVGRLLPQVNYKLIQQNPKPLIGYSDITALHCAIQQHSGLVTFHGPVGSSELTAYTQKQLEKVLFDPAETYTIPLATANVKQGETDSAYQYRVLGAGVAQGPLSGGNLSLLAAAAGTGYAPKVKGHILFIEDIGESPYRIDRMLTTLRQAWPLEEAAAIVLGIFNDCEAKAGSNSLSLQQTIDDRLGDLAIPVVYGFSFGHIDNMCTLPMGVEARIDTATAELQLLEAAVK